MLNHCIVLDLETTLLAKGAKRKDAKIFEIGAVHLPSGAAFHTMVNPFKVRDLVDMRNKCESSSEFEKTLKGLHHYKALARSVCELKLQST